MNRRFYSNTPEINGEGTLKRSPFSKDYKNKYELTQEQREALIGLILSDGFLERGKPTHNTRFRVEHAYPEQESYVLNVRALFTSLIAMEPVINVRKADPRTGKVYKSLYVRTLRFSCLNLYHDLFYLGKKKVVPRGASEARARSSEARGSREERASATPAPSNIQDLLTPRGLAYLIPPIKKIVNNYSAFR